MIKPDGGTKVLEFNCRMGDPETQPIMMRLKSDLFMLVEHAVNGTLKNIEAEWDRRVALGVVMAADGYPDNPRKGDEITGLPRDGDDFHVFHAGTATQGWQGAGHRRTRAVRHRARGYGARGAAARL